MEVDFFTPNVAFFVCVTLSRYMKIGENLLNEVPVEKSILVDFDQFITFVNKWKAKWVHEGYSWFKKKKKKTPKRTQCRQYSLHLIYFFCSENNCKDS